ncbi:lysylphosphatidylglycerol synthase transmembrane domain-containing protein [Pontibacter sp. CAU 1760]
MTPVRPSLSQHKANNNPRDDKRLYLPHLPSGIQTFCIYSTSFSRCRATMYAGLIIESTALMALTKQKLQQQISARTFLLPGILGLVVVGFMLYHTYVPGQFKALLNANFLWIGIAMAALLVRDFGYVYRLRFLTDKVLTWKKSFQVIMLWEFASCALPAVVGGTTVGAYILYKEKIPLGKSVAQVMVASMLDNSYFALAVPLVLYFTQGNLLPEMAGLNETLRQSLGIAFLVSYTLVACYAFTLFYAIFINPKAVKRVLMKLAGWKAMQRWQVAMQRHANELFLSSRQLRSKNLAYWLHAGSSTFIVWTARYVVIGCLIAAFTHLNLQEHLLIFSRNLIYKIVLLVSVTPGATGIAELVFPAFFGTFLGSFTTVVVLLYRLLTHYVYLFIGTVVFPGWAARVYKNGELQASEHAQKLAATQASQVA